MNRTDEVLWGLFFIFTSNRTRGSDSNRVYSTLMNSHTNNRRDRARPWLVHASARSNAIARKGYARVAQLDRRTSRSQVHCNPFILEELRAVFQRTSLVIKDSVDEIWSCTHSEQMDLRMKSCMSRKAAGRLTTLLRLPYIELRRLSVAPHVLMTTRFRLLYSWEEGISKFKTNFLQKIPTGRCWMPSGLSYGSMLERKRKGKKRREKNGK